MPRPHPESEFVGDGNPAASGIALQEPPEVAEQAVHLVLPDSREHGRHPLAGLPLRPPERVLQNREGLPQAFLGERRQAAVAQPAPDMEEHVVQERTPGQGVEVNQGLRPLDRAEPHHVLEEELVGAGGVRLQPGGGVGTVTRPVALEGGERGGVWAQKPVGRLPAEMLAHEFLAEGPAERPRPTAGK